MSTDVTCGFDRQSCRHSSLFLGEYKRTNRTKGTKILRCFPHCCPEHVNRSYCGTALYVKVTSAPRTTVDVADLMVFAHFEESDANFLSVNDEINASLIADSIQTEQTPKGEWIEGFEQASAGYDEQNAHLFEINPGARWYYEWESAATKAQRFTKHVLRVYVLERSYKQEQLYAAPSTTLRVVAVATSSEFMVVSYRRATSEIRADRRILAMLVSNAGISPAALQSSSVDGDSDSGLLPLDPGPLMLQHARYSAAEKQAIVFPLHHQSPTTSNDCSPLRYTGNQIQQDHGDIMWQEKKLWESAHPETLMLTKHLAIIYYFLTSADATRLTHCLSQWSTIFANQWFAPPAQAGAREQQQQHSPQRYHPYGSSPDRNEAQRAQVSNTNSKISWYFMMKLASTMGQAGQYQYPAHARRSGEEPHADKLSFLVEACADVAGWLVFDADNISLFRRLFTEYAPTLLNKDALRGTFVKWVRLVYDLIGHYLASSFASVTSAGGHIASTQALVEEIIAIVFKCDELEAIRPKVLSILSSTSMHGLAGFVAQVRSQFVRKSQQGSNSPDGTRNNMALTRLLQTFTSPLQGNWQFDGTQTVIEPLDLSQIHTIGLGNALDWLRECSVVSIQAQDDKHLAIRSLWNMSGRDDEHAEGMVLVADGHARVFSHFPSGLSSMIVMGDKRYGNYQASFVAPDALALELYAWPESESSEGPYARESTTPSWGSESGGAPRQTAMRWKLRLSMERFGRPTATPGASILRVEVIVDQGTFSAASASALEADSLQERLRAIDEWKSVYQVSAIYRRAQ